MPSPAKLVLGMMSGTSADGIDTALVNISGAPPNLKINLLNHTHQSFPLQIRKEILRVAEQNPLTPEEFSQLHACLGNLYAEAALVACKKFRIPPKKIDLIGNHGQTIFHQGVPTKFLGKPTASTLQLGDGSAVANLTGITTVSDFRPADMAQGGQGAPLVPFADYALYAHPKLGRISLNIGGISNITVIPANAKPSGVLAFDTGPGNMLIDALVHHFTHGRYRFDRHAALARQGHLHHEVLAQLLRDPYFKLRPPKSTGREYFGAVYVKKILALARRYKLKSNDVLHTVTVFTAASIADALHRFVLRKGKIHQLIVSGGGAQNPLLMSQLAAFLPNVEVRSSLDFSVPTDAKEALAFAILAYETFHQRPSNIPTATGARGPAILGKISYAPPR
jgi:Predicted molecular chaperone distantly related to HSP70-fold metalloproteases